MCTPSCPSKCSAALASAVLIHVTLHFYMLKSCFWLSQSTELRLAAMTIVVVVAVDILSLRKCPWGLRRMRATQSRRDHNSSEREESRSKAWVWSPAELGNGWGVGRGGERLECAEVVVGAKETKEGQLFQ